MLLSENKAHCIARLLQAALFGGDDKHFGCPFDGCQYCKVQCYKQGDNRFPLFESLRSRLMEETGVDVGIAHYDTIPNSNFPYKKFLKNANEEIKDYFRKEFANI